jgi:Protein of unknown function (DUF3616)
MTRRVLGAWVFFVVCVHVHAGIVATDVRIGLTYKGACDASAAAAVDDARFVIATDEMDDDHPGRVNRFHVYQRDAALPVADVDVTPAVQHQTLPTDSKKDNRECDFEGAARVKDRIFWITSHAPNSKGKSRPDRYRLMAIDVNSAGTKLQLPGDPAPLPAYGRLFDDLAADKSLSDLHLTELKSTPPEKCGLNIEGLARTREGTLLIGLRSPLSQNKAVLIPLRNGNELVMGTETKAKLGKPIFLDLGLRGIRDIVFWEAKDVYVIVAGSHTDGPDDFALFSWKIGGTPQELKDDAGRSIALRGLHPESLVLLESGELLVLSDDGDEPASSSDKTQNKDLASAQRTFRTMSMKLEEK